MRIINRDDVFDNKSYRSKLKEKVCFCSWCGFHSGENIRKHTSRWGKKVAKKHQYATGKGRDESPYKSNHYWRGMRLANVYDAHYDEKAPRQERKYIKMKTTKGDALEMLDGYIKFLKSNRNKIADDISKGLNKQPWKWSFTSAGDQSWGEKRGSKDLNWYWQVRVYRDQPYRVRADE